MSWSAKVLITCSIAAVCFVALVIYLNYLQPKPAAPVVVPGVVNSKTVIYRPVFDGHCIAPSWDAAPEYYLEHTGVTQCRFERVVS